MILIATLGGLGALLFWGLSDYFTGKSGQQRDEYLTNVVLQMVVAAIMLPVVLWYGFSVGLNTTLAIMVGISLLFTIAFISYIKAMASGPFGITVPIANSYAFITLLVAIFFFQFQLSALHFLALLVIIIGIIMLTVNKTSFHTKNLRSPAILFAFITMLSWGIAFALIETIVTELPWHNLLFLLTGFMTIFSLIAYIAIRKKLPALRSLAYSNMKFAYQSGILSGIGFIAFFASAEYTGSVIIAAVIAAASPLVTSFLAYIRDGEKLSLYKRIGAIAVVLGVMLLNL